jgi:hypothetical protein
LLVVAIKPSGVPRPIVREVKSDAVKRTRAGLQALREGWVRLEIGPGTTEDLRKYLMAKIEGIDVALAALARIGDDS